MNSLNPLSVDAVGRRPRGAVSINGTEIGGWSLIEVQSNAYRSADTFRVEFAASGLPESLSIDWFLKQDQIEVDICGGMVDEPDSEQSVNLPLWISGFVDAVDYNPVAGTLVLTGKDYSTVLLDTPCSIKLTNQKSSDVVTAIAKKHGLMPVVVPTKEVIGKAEYNGKTLLQNAKNEWDLICALANKEEYLVYLRGYELHFAPRDASKSAPYVIQWQVPDKDFMYPRANVISLSFKCDAHLSKGVTATVESVHAGDGKRYSKTYPPSQSSTPKAKKSGSKINRPDLQCVMRTTNMRPDECESAAQQLHDQYAQHQMQLSATLLGDDLLWPKSEVSVQVMGTGTAFDQTYWPDSVSRTLSTSGGYVMTLAAKNSRSDVKEGK